MPRPVPPEGRVKYCRDIGRVSRERRGQPVGLLGAVRPRNCSYLPCSGVPLFLYGHGFVN